jgi:hypothetical protein
MQAVIIKIAKSWTGDEGIKINQVGVNKPSAPLSEYGKIVGMGEGWHGQFASSPEIDKFTWHLKYLFKLHNLIENYYTSIRNSITFTPTAGHRVSSSFQADFGRAENDCVGTRKDRFGYGLDRHGAWPAKCKSAQERGQRPGGIGDSAF